MHQFKRLRLALMVSSAIFLTGSATIPLWLARAQSLDTMRQQVADNTRRVAVIEAFNIPSELATLRGEIATLRETTRGMKETQDRGQTLLYGVFACLLALVVERALGIRDGKGKSEGS